MTLRLKTGLEPCHLVVESRSGSRVAAWQIKASDKQAVDRCLDVSAVGIVGIAGKPATSKIAFSGYIAVIWPPGSSSESSTAVDSVRTPA